MSFWEVVLASMIGFAPCSVALYVLGRHHGRHERSER